MQEFYQIDEWIHRHHPGVIRRNWNAQRSLTDSLEILRDRGVLEVQDSIDQLEFWMPMVRTVQLWNHRVTVIVENIPPEWPVPANLRVLRSHWALMRCLEVWRRLPWPTATPTATHDFCLPYHGEDRHRDWIYNQIADRGILEHSHHSRPRWHDRPARSMEHQGELTRDLRESHDRNHDSMIGFSQASHCHIALENQGILPYGDATITEKSLWAIRAGRPAVWIMSPAKQRQLAQWGFRPCVPPRSEALEILTDLEQIRQRIHQPAWFAENQAVIQHNQHGLRGLEQRLWQEIQQEWQG